LQEALRAKQREGLILQLLFWSTCAGIGPLFGGLLGLVLAAIAIKKVGPMGGAASAVLAGGAMVFLCAGVRRAVRATLLWILGGGLLWIGIWVVGSTWFEWRIADTLFVWVLGAVVIATPGCGWASAWRVATGDRVFRRAPLGGGEGQIAMPIWMLLIGWSIGLVTRLIPHRGIREVTGAALAAALGGALGGGFGGGAFGAFSGDIGVETIHDALGGAIGGAILGAFGAACGGIRAMRILRLAP
jgi:hypothetical protein